MKFPVITALLLLGAPAALANDYTPKLQALAQGEIKAIVSDPVLIAAIIAQNSQTASKSQAEIDALDKSWRAEVGAAAHPMIDAVLGNPAAAVLKSAQAASGGRYTEIFVMDQVGLNVASSAETSDYWQGDEAKWQETFAKGADAIHVSEVELDESSQTYQAQVSVAVADPATGAVIGAATFGVNVDLLN